MKVRGLQRGVIRLGPLILKSKQRIMMFAFSFFVTVTATCAKTYQAETESGVNIRLNKDRSDSKGHNIRASSNKTNRDYLSSRNLGIVMEGDKQGENSISKSQDPSCRDNPIDWHDSGGEPFNCTWYKNQGCPYFDRDFENFNKIAQEACCACDGGVEISDEIALPLHIAELQGDASKSLMCEDDPKGWHDSDGENFDCKWYKKNGCPKMGSNFQNFNKIAQEACCACGGGTWQAEPSPVVIALNLDVKVRGSFKTLPSPVPVNGKNNDGSYSVVKRSAALLKGNIWQAIPFEYNVTIDTILEFDFELVEEIRVHAICLEDDLELSQSHCFQLGGNQEWTARIEPSDSASGIKHYVIKISENMPEIADIMGNTEYLVLVQDSDSNISGESKFSNIVVREEITTLQVVSDASLVSLTRSAGLENMNRDGGGDITVINEGSTLLMKGNMWSAFPINYDVTNETLAVFDFNLVEIAEIHAICFVRNLQALSKEHCFQLAGTQNWGTQLQVMEVGDETKTYVINFSEHFGSEGEIGYIVLVQDNDASTRGESTFSNIAIREIDTPVLVRTNTVVGRPLISDVTSGFILAPLQSVEIKSPWMNSQVLKHNETLCSFDDVDPIESLTPEQRDVFATKWRESAQQEHASVASFAKFGLQLQASAAPPHLVRAAHEAAIEEIGHAQLCLGAASSFVDTAFTFGELPLTSIEIDGSLVNIAYSTAIEGALGETVAAFRAAVQQQFVVKRGGVHHIAQVLDTIMREETKHAILAWNTLNWVLETATDGNERDQIMEAISKGLDLQESNEDMSIAWANETELPMGFGHLDEMQSRAVERLVKENVIQVIRDWMFQQDRLPFHLPFTDDSESILMLVGGSCVLRVANYFMCLMSTPMTESCSWETATFE